MRKASSSEGKGRGRCHHTCPESQSITPGGPDDFQGAGTFVVLHGSYAPLGVYLNAEAFIAVLEDAAIFPPIPEDSWRVQPVDSIEEAVDVFLSVYPEIPFAVWP